MTEASCPICKSEEIKKFIDILDVPAICNAVCATKKEALRTPKGDIKLGFCKNCGHVFNTGLNSDIFKYASDYENSLDFSKFFRDYEKSLIKRLIKKHDLHNKTILEIGCGKGNFLKLLCESGNNRGIGFDPAYEVGRNKSEKVNFIKDYYSNKYTDYKADFICCLKALEHAQDPLDIVRNARKAISSTNAAVYFEIPNFILTLKKRVILELIYEHYSYFTKSSINYLFNSCGLKIRSITRAFDSQYLCIEARPAENIKEKRDTRQIKELLRLVNKFSHEYQAKLNGWKLQLKKIKQKNQKAVIWGAGAKGVTFLNLTKAPIEYAVDINPYKQGTYVAGTGQKIVAPNFLKEYKPDIVIVMNKAYMAEIKKALDEIGLRQNYDPTVI